MAIDKIELGAQGENLIIEYLENLNFEILSKNYKTKYGEIDIIASKNDLIIFVEVKLRRSPKFILSDLISYSKQKKIIKTALNYISINKIFNKILRFDVGFVEFWQDHKYNINYIENAFTSYEY